MASCILRRVNNLGLDDALFLTDFKFLQLSGLPPFYQGVFKSCALFNWTHFQESDSLHWLLKAPLVCGGRLDVCSSATPGLMGALCSSKIVTLKQLVDTVGPALSDAQALSSVLGVRSVRLIQRCLELWRQRLSVRERGLLLRYGRGEAEHNPTDIFPDLHLSPASTELNSPLLKVCYKEKLSLHKADRQTLYMNCVKVINEKGLCNRAATTWKDRLGGQSPQWRTLYNPPLKKRTGDIQWRILHGAIATNAFVSVLNGSVLNKCPFCSLRVFFMFLLSAGG